MSSQTPLVGNFSAPERERLLRRPEVLDITGLSRSALYRDMLNGDFPRGVRVGKRAVRWRASEIRSWAASLPVAR